MLQIIKNRAHRVSTGSHAALVLPLQVVRSWIVQWSGWRPSLPLQIEVYRPEAHYMRGPGPKHRAKWAQAPNCEL
ncbi:MAG: hypothetical protein ABW200_13040 [Hyphomicrobiaceae bacterium]|jgi:hypothetical protein